MTMRHSFVGLRSPGSHSTPLRRNSCFPPIRSSAPFQKLSVRLCPSNLRASWCCSCTHCGPGLPPGLPTAPNMLYYACSSTELDQALSIIRPLIHLSVPVALFALLSPPLYTLLLASSPSESAEALFEQMPHQDEAKAEVVPADLVPMLRRLSEANAKMPAAVKRNLAPRIRQMLVVKQHTKPLGKDEFVSLLVALASSE
eukprot:RCo010466